MRWTILDVFAATAAVAFLIQSSMVSVQTAILVWTLTTAGVAFVLIAAQHHNPVRWATLAALGYAIVAWLMVPTLHAWSQPKWHTPNNVGVSSVSCPQ